MTWAIEFNSASRKQLSKLAKSDAARIISFLEERISGTNNPRQIGSALQGTRFEHLWRYRVGDYRIICDIQDDRLVVLVVEIGHRRDVYR